MIKTFKEAELFLYSLIRPTTFARIEADSILIDPLERMRILLEHLGDPHKSYPSIHVSGTSGKGSTAYFISQILKEAGYKTGLTISPHLEKVSERIFIDGEVLTDGEFVQYLQEIEPVVEKMRKSKIGAPSYFEVLIACAFLSFQRAKIDIAVVEVGLEGRFDATNVLTPLVGVLTNISLDHTAILGSTVELIATEAVSFISEGMHLVTGVTQPTLQRIITDAVHSKKITASFLGKDFDYEIVSSNNNGSIFSWIHGKIRSDNIEVSLPGLFQIDNATLAIEAVSQLEDFVVSGENVRFALANSYFPGRFEIINKNIILDGAHNQAKMNGFLTSLREYYKNTKKIFILSFKKQKEIDVMIDNIIPLADEVILTKFSTPTDTDYLAAIEPQVIESVFKKKGYRKNIVLTDSVPEAVQIAKEKLKEDTLVIFTGSLYLVGEARTYFKE